jgi:hypothetical protein
LSNRKFANQGATKKELLESIFGDTVKRPPRPQDNIHTEVLERRNLPNIANVTVGTAVATETGGTGKSAHSFRQTESRTEAKIDITRHTEHCISCVPRRTQSDTIVEHRVSNHIRASPSNTEVPNHGV